MAGIQEKVRRLRGDLKDAFHLVAISFGCAFFLSLSFDAQIKKSQKEKQFLQSCRGSTLDKQQTIKVRKPSGTKDTKASYNLPWAHLLSDCHARASSSP